MSRKFIPMAFIVIILSVLLLSVFASGSISENSSFFPSQSASYLTLSSDFVVSEDEEIFSIESEYSYTYFQNTIHFGEPVIWSLNLTEFNNSHMLGGTQKENSFVRYQTSPVMKKSEVVVNDVDWKMIVTLESNFTESYGDIHFIQELLYPTSVVSMHSLQNVTLVQLNETHVDILVSDFNQKSSFILTNNIEFAETTDLQPIEIKSLIIEKTVVTLAPVQIVSQRNFTFSQNTSLRSDSRTFFADGVGEYTFSTSQGDFSYIYLDENQTVVFEIMNVTNNATYVTIDLPYTLDVDVVYYFWKEVNGEQVKVPYQLSDDGKQLTIALQDGFVDNDGAINGRIVDPFTIPKPVNLETDVVSKVTKNTGSLEKKGEKTKVLASKGVLSSLKLVNPADIISNPYEAIKFPYDLSQFTITDLDVGETITIELTYPHISDNEVVIKYNSQTDKWYKYPFKKINATTVQITLTDGGVGDDDGVANGIIIDDVGLVTLDILTVQSYPTVGGIWRTDFTTTGTANLTISAVDGTTYGDSAPADLKPLELRCGETLVPFTQLGNELFFENYSCSDISYWDVFVQTPDAHHQSFEYGTELGFAHNTAIYAADGIQVRAVHPDPIDKDREGRYGIVIFNPTGESVNITRVDINGSDSTQQVFKTIAQGAVDSFPTSGWSLANGEEISWSGTYTLGAEEIIGFFVTGDSNRKDESFRIEYTAIVNGTFYQDPHSHYTVQQNANLPFTQLAFETPTDYPVFNFTANSTTQTTFSIALEEASNKAPIPVGSLLTIEVPEGFTGITDVGGTGWDTATISGSTIEVLTTQAVINQRITYNFNATTPSVGGLYELVADMSGPDARAIIEGGVKIVDVTPPEITINSPSIAFINYSTSLVLFNVTLNEAATCDYSLDGGVNNVTMTTSDDLVFTHTNASVSDAIYNLNFYCADVYGNTNSTSRVFTVDTIPPTVSIDEPQNTTYATNQLSLNYTVSDATSGVASCRYNQGGSNITLTSCLNLSSYVPAQGTTNVTVYATDYAGLTSSESVVFFVDSIDPVVSFGALTRPNASTFFSTNILVEAVVTEANFANITYRLYDNTQTLINETTYSSLVTTINWTGLANSNTLYYYNITVYDEVGRFGSSPTRELILTSGDVEGPVVTVLSPVPDGVYLNTTSLLFNISLDEIGDTCLYNLNTTGINITMTKDSTTLFSNSTTLSDDSYGVTFYCNDTAGNVGEYDWSFGVDTIVPTISYISPTPNQLSKLMQDWISVNVSVTEVNEKNITFALYNTTDLVFQNTSTTAQREINWTNLVDGRYYFNVTIFDFASNTAKTATRTVDLDFTKPTITNVNDTPDPVDFLGIINITADVTDANTITSVVVESNDINYTMSLASGNTYYNSSVATNTEYGVFTYTIYATDSYGNTQTSAGHNFTIQGGLSIQDISVRAAHPDPIDTDQVGKYAVIIFNPTDSPLDVTDVTIDGSASAQQIFANVVQGAGNSWPTAGWVRDASRTIVTWSGTETIPAKSSYAFWVTIDSNKKDETFVITYSATVNGSTYADPHTHRASQATADLPFTQLSFSEGATYPLYNLTVETAQEKMYSISMEESANKVSIPVGATLTIKLPAGFTDIVPIGGTGWGTGSVDGNIITVTSTSSVLNDRITYSFNATSPAVGGSFVIDAGLSGSNARADLEGSLVVSDTTAPTITINNPIVDNSNFTSTGVLFAVTIDETGSACNVSVDGGLTNNSMNTGNDRYFSYFNSSMDLGAYTATFYCADLAGNVGTNTRNFGVDDTPPLVTIIVPGNSSYDSKPITMNYTFTDAGLGVKTCQYNQGGANISLVACANLTSYSPSEGTTNLTIYATDYAGNTNSTSVVFFMDSIDPVVTYGAQTRPNASTFLSTYIYVDTLVTETNFANITYRLYNATFDLLNETTYTSLVSNINFSGLNNSNMVYYYNVSVYDDYGHVGSTQTRQITLTPSDIEGPVITVLEPTPDGVHLATSSVLFNISLDEAALGCVYNLNTTGVNLSMTQESATRYSYSDSLADAHYQAIFYCNDTSNNVGLTTWNFTVDTLNPLMSYIAPTPSNESFISDGSITVNVSIDEINEDAVTFALYNISGLVYSNVTTAGTRSITWDSLGDGTYYFNVSVVDKAGNANQTVQRVVYLDNTDPLISSIVDSPDPVTFLGTINFTASVTDNVGLSTVILNAGGVNYAMSLASGSTYYNDSVDTATSTGVFTYYITATDTYGNTQVSANYTYSIEAGLSVVEVGVRAAHPDPVGSAETGKYALNAFNPGIETLYVTSVEINATTATNNVFAGITQGAGNSWPTTGWTLTNGKLVTWSGNESLTGYNATQFWITVDSNNQEETFTVAYRANINNTWYQQEDTRNAVQTSADAPFTQLAMEDAGNYPEYLIYTDTSEQNMYAVSLEETANTEFLPSGAILSIELPNVFTNISTVGGTGWDTASISGQMITVETSASLKNERITFNFSAKSPANPGVYVIRSSLSGINARAILDTGVVVEDITVPTVTLDYPVDSFNSSSATNSFNYTVSDESAITSCSLYGNWSGSWIIEQTQSNPTKDSTQEFSGETIADGTYVWGVQCTDVGGNIGVSANRTISVDSLGPQISFVPPTKANDSTVSDSWIFANVSVVEENEKNITFALYNSSFDLVASQTFTNQTHFYNFTGLASGDYYYNVSVNDFSGKTNVTQTRLIHLQGIDLEIVAMTFPSTIIEGQLYNVTLNVSNSDPAPATNVNVQVNMTVFGSPSVLLAIENVTLTIPAQSAALVNATFTAVPGIMMYAATVDYTNTFSEGNESNNDFSLNNSISAWEIQYGAVDNFNKVLWDTDNNGFTTWSLATPRGVYYYGDVDANWLPFDLGVFTQTNDFNESDTDLGMTYFNDSIQKLFDADNNGVADQTRNISIAGTYMDVPVTNSTNSGSFVTGILFDTDDGATYNGTHDLVFITILNASQVGMYGTYDYEVRIPSGLATQVPSTNSVERIAELD